MKPRTNPSGFLLTVVRSEASNSAGDTALTTSSLLPTLAPSSGQFVKVTGFGQFTEGVTCSAKNVPSKFTEKNIPKHMKQR